MAACVRQSGSSTQIRFEGAFKPTIGASRDEILANENHESPASARRVVSKAHESQGKKRSIDRQYQVSRIAATSIPRGVKETRSDNQVSELARLDFETIAVSEMEKLNRRKV